jgi:hypothetical protein
MFKIICDVQNVDFYKGDCGMCPGTEYLIKNTEQTFEDNIDNMSCRQWIATDRSTMETAVQSCTVSHIFFWKVKHRAFVILL